MPEPMSRRKPWYRARNVVLAIVLAMALVIGWFGLDVWNICRWWWFVVFINDLWCYSTEYGMYCSLSLKCS